MTPLMFLDKKWPGVIRRPFNYKYITYSKL